MPLGSEVSQQVPERDIEPPYKLAYKVQPFAESSRAEVRGALGTRGVLKPLRFVGSVYEKAIRTRNCRVVLFLFVLRFPTVQSSGSEGPRSFPPLPTDDLQ